MDFRLSFLWYMAEAVVALVNAGRESLNHINFFLILGIFPKAWLCFEQEPIYLGINESINVRFHTLLSSFSSPKRKLDADDSIQKALGRSFSAERIELPYRSQRLTWLGTTPNFTFEVKEDSTNSCRRKSSAQGPRPYAKHLFHIELIFPSLMIWNWS